MSTTSDSNRDGTPVDKTTLETEFEGARSSDDVAPRALSPEAEKRLWFKVDLRVMPILCLMFSFIDRGNIGNPRLEGLFPQLTLTEHNYNISITVFFIIYCVLECPSNLVLKVFRPSRWLPAMGLSWGIVLALTGLVKTYPQIIAVRFCLGVAEAGFLPGVAYYLTFWYPRHMLMFRIGLFFGLSTIAGGFAGLLAFLIDYMTGIGHLAGWVWLFIIKGIVSFLFSTCALFMIFDSPSTATFLTPEERAYLVWRIRYDNSTVGEEEHFSLRQVIAAFTDWQVYLHLLVYMSVTAPLYGITFFLPTVINNFGCSAAVSQLLFVPPFIVAANVIVVWGWYSDQLRIRSAFIYAGLLLLLIGYAINISNTSNGAKYFGTFLIVTGSYASCPAVISWLGNNLVGQYKRSVGMAIQIGFGNFSGAIAANIYRSQDSPRYVLGHGLELMFVGIGLIVVPILVLSYKHINDARDGALQQHTERGEKVELTVQELRDLGDRAPDFRYTL